MALRFPPINCASATGTHFSARHTVHSLACRAVYDRQTKHRDISSDDFASVAVHVAIPGGPPLPSIAEAVASLR